MPKVLQPGERNGDLEVVEYLGKDKDELRTRVLVKNLVNGAIGGMTTHDFRFQRKQLLSAEDRRKRQLDMVSRHSLQELVGACSVNGMTLLHPVTEGPVWSGSEAGRWNIRCSCGYVYLPAVENVLVGSSRSCGCVKSWQQMAIFKWVQTQGLTALWNDRQQIAPLELDIWIPEKKLAIEYCGLWCHGELFNAESARLKHHQKWEACGKKGIRLITIFEDEWLTRQSVVLGFLSTILGLPAKQVGARKLNVEVLDVKTARAFLTKNHLQGAGGYGEYFGLMDDSGALLAAMSFAASNASRHRAAHQGVYELVRYCVAPGISIPGGPERLLGAWKAGHPEATSLISYSDNRWSAGNLYRRLGFVMVSPGIPSYWYFKAHTQGPRKHRYGWRKSVAVKTFNADPTLTEWQIMSANGWDRIWDCGSATWELALRP